MSAASRPPDPRPPWAEANQRHLVAALALLRSRLRCAAEGNDEDDEVERSAAEVERARAALEAPEGGRPAAIDTLAEVFDLSPFERDLVLLAAGVELDASFAAHAAPVTFGRALAVLPGAHWSALAPDQPLRRWRLLAMASGPSLTEAPLRIDERVLHYLTGVETLDEYLAGLLDPVPVGSGAAELVPSHRRLAAEMVALWRHAERPLPMLHLLGGDPATRRAVAASAAGSFGLGLHALAAPLLPAAADELEALARLWERESALSHAALLLELDDRTASDPARDAALARWLDSVRGPVFLSGGERRPPRHRPLVAFEVAPPTPDEQRRLWRDALAGEEPRCAPEGEAAIDALVGSFRMAPGAIRSATARALAAAAEGDIGARLWDAAREQARPRLDGLASRIEPRAGWDELVLPQRERATLGELAAQVRRGLQVHEGWGFAERCGRGLGVSSLFTGASGTGKTLAAEVLARELGLDLYRIDLASIVSKYIGETEKNLRRVFDTAQDGGAILLFDEADALFGKRSEVKDSHDRYANLEVGYLLQRMETYRGLAILTSNMRSALDKAFLRRLRFVVDFPFPDERQRAEIWRRAFPAAAPTEGLDVEALAKLHVAGGSIRNIALGAAFLAAEEGTAVTMAHLLRASRSELQKLDKPLNETEVRGWVTGRAEP